MITTADRYGRVWDLPASELCPTCGQPDNCGECTHEPLTADEAKELGAISIRNCPFCGSKVRAGSSHACN